jgi:hypothetical protein
MDKLFDTKNSASKSPITKKHICLKGVETQIGQTTMSVMSCRENIDRNFLANDKYVMINFLFRRITLGQ